MMEINVDGLVQRIIENVQILRESNIINAEVISDHTQTTKQNLHGWLQYLAMKSVLQSNLIGVPETKLYFSKPLDLTRYGIKRKRNFVRVDIAVYENYSKLKGFIECMTFDEAHECFTTEEVNRRWFTARDKLPNCLKLLEPKPEFVILLVVLPTIAKQTPWRTKNPEIDEILIKKRYYDDLSPVWKKLIDELKEETDARLVIINEKTTCAYP